MIGLWFLNAVREIDPVWQLAWLEDMGRGGHALLDVPILLPGYEPVTRITILLLTPSLPISTFPAGQLAADSSQRSWLEWAPFSYPFNLTQQPACSVPCGLTRDGLPVGLQIVAGRFRDGLVLRAAAVYEAAHPARMPAISTTRHDRETERGSLGHEGSTWISFGERDRRSLIWPRSR